MAELMSFQDAAQRQHLYGSYYTVWLVSPEGRREYLNYTARKSMQGLVKVLHFGSSVRKLTEMFGIESVNALRFTMAKGVLSLSNGWKVQFGGTIRQEAR